ncbi:hypothetical protein C8J57DRAFT_1512743 [Mycena rebaudengoi]|nr:hypothetical protein C8J57DRAFT_1512743 [Mycena rebaudengoi]
MSTEFTIIRKSPRLPIKLIGRILSFFDEYDPSLEIADYISFHGCLHLVFPCIVASVPCLWAHMILSPNIDFAFVQLCFSLARNYPLSIHIRIHNLCFFHADRHNGLAISQHFRRALQLVSSAMSTCADLTIESGVPTLMDIVLEEIAPTTPSILSQLSIVITPDNPYFLLFHPPCLMDFICHQAPSFGQPFHPLISLSIASDRVTKPVFTHVATQNPRSLVQLPLDFRLE